MNPRWLAPILVVTVVGCSADLEEMWSCYRWSGPAVLGSIVLWTLVYAICCGLLAQIRMTVGGHRVPTLELAAQATTNGLEADTQPPSFAVHPPGAPCNAEYEVTWGVPATERSVWLEPEE